MKTLLFYLNLFLAVLFLNSCDNKIVEADFENLADKTIYKYLEENKEQYSSAYAVLEKSGLLKTLSAYNPKGDGYTLFLPDNQAFAEFIASSTRFSSLEDILNDMDYVISLSKYHILNMSIKTNNFPYGAFSEPVASGDYLTVNVVIEKDSAYYKINNVAPVILKDLEFTNGYIHIISKVLSPITQTSFSWMEENGGFTIFTEAAEATGLKELLDINTRIEGNTDMNYTLLVEHDSIFNKVEIYNLNDLVQYLGADISDFTSPDNPLYLFVAYHAFSDTYFLDDLQGQSTNYGTFALMPVSINGLGIDIKINTGSEIFDTINNNGVIILENYIGIYYDESNVITLSGAIHFINHLLKPFSAGRAIKTFQFDEPLFNEYKKIPGSYMIEDTASLKSLKWWGSELTYTKSDDESEKSWEKDYISISGDFVINYRFPALVKGKYAAFIHVNSYGGANPVIEVYLDGVRLGGLFDLTKGGTSSNPYKKIKLSDVTFERFEEHTITIKSLIPGNFVWDYLRFEPI